jgi:hypothetical protein
MRRILLLTGLAVTLCVTTAGAIGLGVEPYGGISWPALQDDRGQGSTWGIRVPVSLLPYMTAEPYYSSASYGDKTLDTIAGPQTFDGGTVTAWGVNLLIATGGPAFKFYPFVGIGSNTDKRDVTGDVTSTGYNFGIGFFVGLPAKLSLDVRGEGQMIVSNDVSRKFGNLTFGLAYHFLSLP